MKRFGVIAAMLVVVLLTAPTYALAEKRDTAYSAFGDSIAVGTGGTNSVGYVDLLLEHLDHEYATVTFYDVSHDGMTSGMLMSHLTNPLDPNYAMYNSAAASGIFMTVSIGGNDILQPVMAFLQVHPECMDPAYLASLTPPEEAALVAELTPTWTGRGSSPSTRHRSCVHADGKSRRGDGRQHCLQSVYARRRSLRISDPYVRALNEVIIGCAANPSTAYKVADVYTKFSRYHSPKKPLVHGVIEANALHPTDRGYKKMYKLVKHVMKE